MISPRHLSACRYLEGDKCSSACGCMWWLAATFCVYHRMPMMDGSWIDLWQLSPLFDNKSKALYHFRSHHLSEGRTRIGNSTFRQCRQDRRDLAHVSIRHIGNGHDNFDLNRSTNHTRHKTKRKIS